MTTSREEQQQALAHHEGQLAGLLKTIESVEASKADGSIAPEVADATIARWQTFVDLQLKHIGDAQANLAELDAPAPQTVSIAAPGGTLTMHIETDNAGQPSGVAVTPDVVLTQPENGDAFAKAFIEQVAIDNGLTGVATGEPVITEQQSEPVDEPTESVEPSAESEPPASDEPAPRGKRAK